MARHPHWLVRGVEAVAMLPVTLAWIWVTALSLTAVLDHGLDEAAFVGAVAGGVTLPGLLVFWALWLVGERAYWTYGDRSIAIMGLVSGCTMTLAILALFVGLGGDPANRYVLAACAAFAVGVHRIARVATAPGDASTAAGNGDLRVPASLRRLSWGGALAVVVGLLARRFDGTVGDLGSPWDLALFAGVLLLLVAFAGRCAFRPNPHHVGRTAGPAR